MLLISADRVFKGRSEWGSVRVQIHLGVGPSICLPVCGKSQRVPAWL